MRALVAMIVMLVGASAAHADDRVNYHTSVIGDSYSDRTLPDGSWKITAVVRAGKPDGSSARIAFYRAAERAIAGGFKFVRVLTVKQKSLSNFVPVGVGGGFSFHSADKFQMTAKGTNDADPSKHCTANVTETCITYDAQAALAEIRPFLKFDKEK